jgi:hypothetical protein
MHLHFGGMITGSLHSRLWTYIPSVFYSLRNLAQVLEIIDVGWLFGKNIFFKRILPRVDFSKVLVTRKGAYVRRIAYPFLIHMTI